MNIIRSNSEEIKILIIAYWCLYDDQKNLLFQFEIAGKIWSLKRNYTLWLSIRNLPQLEDIDS